MGRESTISQMMLFGKYMTFLNKTFDVKDRLSRIEKLTLKDVLDVIDTCFNIDDCATATVGPKRSKIKI